MSLNLDADLFFLESVPSCELDGLVETLTHDPSGRKRLLGSLVKCGSYKEHYPDHHKYVREIAEELQRYGSNTLATQLRRSGCGAEWKDILSSLCGRLELPASRFSSAERMEADIVQLLLNMLLDGVDDDRKKALISYFGIRLRLREDGLSMYYDIRPVIISHPELPSILCGLIAQLGGAELTASASPASLRNITAFFRSNADKAAKLVDDGSPGGKASAFGTALLLKGILRAIDRSDVRWDIILPCAVHIACLRVRSRKEGWNILGSKDEAAQRVLELVQAFAAGYLKKHC